jgi:hypothetical protein
MAPDPTSGVTIGLNKPSFDRELFLLSYLDTLILTVDCSGYLLWTQILTVGCSVYLLWTHWYWLWIVSFTWSGHTNTDCRLFCLHDVDILILTADCSVYLMWTYWYWLRIVLLPDVDTLILTADCSVTWCGHTDIDCVLFCYLMWTHWYWLWIVPFTRSGHTDIDCRLFRYWCWLTDFKIKLTAGVTSQKIFHRQRILPVYSLICAVQGTQITNQGAIRSFLSLFDIHHCKWPGVFPITFSPKFTYKELNKNQWINKSKT